MPIHLEDLLDSAVVEGAEVRAETAAPLRWDLGDTDAGWKALPSLVADATPAEVETTNGALRVRLTETSLAPHQNFVKHYGGISLDVEGLDLDAWSRVLIEARTTAPDGHLGISYNVRRSPGETPDERWATVHWGADVEVVPDGEVHVYRTPTWSAAGPITEPDHRIGELVEELKARGEWQNTLLIVASDHGLLEVLPALERDLADVHGRVGLAALRFGSVAEEVGLALVPLESLSPREVPA